MTFPTDTRSKTVRISTIVLALLLPSAARAGWGDENWGEMIWGVPPPVVPALPVAGLALLAAFLLGLSYWLIAARRRRAKRSPLHS